jgi:hypothetical protein
VESFYQDKARIRCSRDHNLSLVRVGCERLLTKHVLPRLNRPKSP